MFLDSDDIIHLHTQGYPDELVCERLICQCGDIKDGVCLAFVKERGGFVLSFESLENLYFLAKNERKIYDVS